MVINLAYPSKPEEERENTPIESTAAKAPSKPSEAQSGLSRSAKSKSAESGVGSRQTNVRELTRADLLGRREFRALFYSRGLSPAEVIGLLDLSSPHVGTLMRYHGVGGFGYDEVSDDRMASLFEELSDEEWDSVVE